MIRSGLPIAADGEKRFEPLAQAAWKSIRRPIDLTEQVAVFGRKRPGRSVREAKGGLVDKDAKSTLDELGNKRPGKRESRSPWRGARGRGDSFFLLATRVGRIIIRSTGRGQWAVAHGRLGTLACTGAGPLVIAPVGGWGPTLAGAGGFLGACNNAGGNWRAAELGAGPGGASAARPLLANALSRGTPCRWR